MSSIIDAAEEVIQDRHGIIKCILYAIPIFISFILFNMKLWLPFLICSGITVLFLLTVAKIILNNVRSCKDYVHPRVNIFIFIFELIKLFFVMLPMCAVCSTIGYFLGNIQIPLNLDNAQLIYQVILWSILGSIMLASYIFYAKTNKFNEAYNFPSIFTYCTDIFLTIIIGIPRLLLLNLIILGIITYLFYFFFNLNNYYYAFICCLAVSTNIAILAHFLAQVDYETVQHDDDEEDPATLLDTF